MSLWRCFSVASFVFNRASRKMVMLMCTFCSCMGSQWLRRSLRTGSSMQEALSWQLKRKRKSKSKHSCWDSNLGTTNACRCVQSNGKGTRELLSFVAACEGPVVAAAHIVFCMRISFGYEALSWRLWNHEIKHHRLERCFGNHSLAVVSSVGPFDAPSLHVVFLPEVQVRWHTSFVT